MGVKMKRKSRGNRKAMSPGSSSSDSDTSYKAAKRHKAIERRKSFIASDREALNRSQNRGADRRKRKSQNGLGTEESDSDQEKENRPTPVQQPIMRRMSSHQIAARRSMLNVSYGLNSASQERVDPSPNAQPTDKKTLQEIYSTCSALFQAHKITPQNAFSLKLVECLDEIVSDIDKENLPLLARTLEIGGRIYVCRVDCAHSHTIKLATEIASNETNANGDDGGENAADGEDGGGDGEEVVGQRKKKTKKKRSRFIEDNEAKINTRFEDQSSNHALRRASLKMKLHKNVDEEIDFDYLSYFLKPTEPHPLYTEEQAEALCNPGSIPDSHVNADEFKTVPWLPFEVVSCWKPRTYDIWGIPLPDVDLLGLPMSQPSTQGMENDQEYAYNPEDRPNEYPEPIDDGPAGFDDHFADGFEAGHDMGAAAGPDFEQSRTDLPVSLDRLNSLDDLHKYFMNLKGVHRSLQSKFGWAGPIFIKPHRLEARKRPGAGAAKTRKKKPIPEVRYDDILWNHDSNKYDTNSKNKDKTTLDAATMEKWNAASHLIPFTSSYNYLGLSDDELEFREPFEAQDDSSDDNFGNIIRFFTNSNNTIFKLMEKDFKEGKNVFNSSILFRPGAVNAENDDDAGADFEIEAPRDAFDDGSFGDPVGGPDDVADAAEAPNTQGDYSFNGAILSSMFPGTLGTEADPMSLASEFDTIKFARQPKPIDMHLLKVHIKQILIERLNLTEEGMPMLDEETKLDLCQLVADLLKRVPSGIRKHLSVAIAVVALMHVVADNKLFMIGQQSVLEYRAPWIVSRGKAWIHANNIPWALTSHDD